MKTAAAKRSAGTATAGFVDLEQVSAPGHAKGYLLFPGYSFATIENLHVFSY
jgi:hypothetical protein